MKSHERNVLVWLVAQPSRLLLLVVALLLVALTGCGLVESPTAAERIPHPNEVRIRELTKCSAKYFAKETGRPLEIEVEITEHKRVVPCLPPNEKEECIAKGWAMIPGTKVVYWGPFVRDEHEPEPLEEWTLEMLAHHEVAHVAHMTTNERVVEFAAHVAYHNADCRDDEPTSTNARPLIGCALQTSAEEGI